MMSKRANQGQRLRRLRAESLESRQLLHGGGFGGAGVLEAGVAVLFEQLDGNSDGQLAADEMSEAAWGRLSAADTDQGGTVSQAELLGYVKSLIADRVDQLPHSEGHHHEGGGGPHGRPHAGGDHQPLTIAEKVDKLFEADANDNGLTADEVSKRTWSCLSQADADGDGTVTRDELRAYLEAKENGGTDDDGDNTDTGDTGDTTGQQQVQVVAAQPARVAHQVHAPRSFGRRR
jgi:Ca2+-binding EF-hand superfamily protein